MNKEKQRIEIAKILQWTIVEGLRAFPPIYLIKKHVSPEIFEQLACIDHMTIPDYLNDLNAIAEAEEWLWENHSDKFHEYNNILADVAGGNIGSPNHVCAKAEKRSKAFLKVMGKWEEGE